MICQKVKIVYNLIFSVMCEIVTYKQMLPRYVILCFFILDLLKKWIILLRYKTVSIVMKVKILNEENI